MRLLDYKVRVLDSKKGTAAKVRVLIEWSDHRRSWATVGVSDNVIEASWNAMVDAIRLELMRLLDKDGTLSGVDLLRFACGFLVPPRFRAFCWLRVVHGTYWKASSRIFAASSETGFPSTWSPATPVCPPVRRKTPPAFIQFTTIAAARARGALYRELRARRPAVLVMLCSGEPILMKWKWALAFRLPVKVLVVNENGDYFWFDRSNWAIIRRFTLLRAGLSGGDAVRTIGRLLVFPAHIGLSATLCSGDSSPQKGLRMKAIQVYEPGGPGQLKLVDVPVPAPGPGEALVKIAAIGVNFIDVYFRTGLYKADLPIAIGMEAAGSGGSRRPGRQRRGRGRPGGLCHGPRLLRRVRRPCPPGSSSRCRPAWTSRRLPPPCCRA